MRRINLSWFCELGVRLEALTEDKVLNDSTLAVPALRKAREYISPLLESDKIPLSLKASRPVARELIQAIDAALAGGSPQSGQPELTEVWLAAYKFENILEGELAVQSVYMLWPKRAYDLDVLIENGTKIFRESVNKAFTSAERKDIEQAGKCLAVELGTAAAFHIFRATESVIRRYYEAVVGKPPKTKMRNWGAYIEKLRACNADVKVIGALEQIKDLYRNPIIHPEDQVDIEDALSLVGIAETAIGRMIEDMSQRAQAALPPSFPLTNPAPAEAGKEQSS